MPPCYPVVVVAIALMFIQPHSCFLSIAILSLSVFASTTNTTELLVYERCVHENQFSCAMFYDFWFFGFFWRLLPATFYFLHISLFSCRPHTELSTTSQTRQNTFYTIFIHGKFLVVASIIISSEPASNKKELRETRKDISPSYVLFSVV